MLPVAEPAVVGMMATGNALSLGFSCLLKKIK
jgi:hypothetical protein